MSSYQSILVMLSDHQWNVDSAVKLYRFMQTAALPPTGPKKNVEPKNVNVMNPNAGGGIPVAGTVGARPLGQKGVTGTVGSALLPSQQFVAPSSPSTLSKYRFHPPCCLTLHIAKFELYISKC